MATTTLSEFHFKGACEKSTSKLMAYLGKTELDDDPITLLTILDSNGFRDALWALYAIPSFRQIHRQMMALWAEQYSEDLGVHIETLKQQDADQDEADEALNTVRLFIYRKVWTNAWDLDWDYDWASSLEVEWPTLVNEQERQLRDALKGDSDD